MSVLANFKKELISISTATDIGFNSTPTIKQQIETLAESLEVLNPTVEPTSFMELVQGRWQLLYSTFGLERETTLQRLSFGKLPNLKVNVTGIFQEVYLDGQQYINLIEFTVGSGVKGVAAVTGRYRVEDSKRLNIDFLETSVKSATNDLDVSAFRSCLGIDSQSALESKLDFSGWLDIIYLDENLRLMRGNAQNLYVLLRID